MAGIMTIDGQEDIQSQWLTDHSADLRMRLYKAIASGSGTKSPGVLTECDFSGYAAQTPAWSALSEDANSRMRYTATPMSFLGSGAGTTNNVLGWYIKNNSSGKVVWYEPFSAPIVMGGAGSSISLSPTFYFGDLTPPL